MTTPPMPNGEPTPPQGGSTPYQPQPGYGQQPGYEQQQGYGQQQYGQQPPYGGPGAPAPFPSTPPRRGIRRKTIFLIIGGVVALLGLLVAAVVLLFVVLLSATREPVQLADEFVDAMQARDGAKAHSLMSNEAQAASSAFDVQSLADRLVPQWKGEPEVTDRGIAKESGRAKQAIVLYKVELTSGGTAYLRVVEVEENDEWKVFNFDSSPTPYSLN